MVGVSWPLVAGESCLAADVVGWGWALHGFYGV